MFMLHAGPQAAFWAFLLTLLGNLFLMFTSHRFGGFHEFSYVGNIQKQDWITWDLADRGSHSFIITLPLVVITWCSQAKFNWLFWQVFTFPSQLTIIRQKCTQIWFEGEAMWSYVECFIILTRIQICQMRHLWVLCVVLKHGCQRGQRAPESLWHWFPSK